MSECEHLQQCPVWKNFSSVAGYVWIKNYCNGPRQARCARLQLLREGKAVPVDLLPNGTRTQA